MSSSTASTSPSRTDLADVDPALHDLAADAERLVHLVARVHGAEVAIGFAGCVVAQLGGADRPRRLGGAVCLQPQRGEQRRYAPRREGFRSRGDVVS